MCAYAASSTAATVPINDPLLPGITPEGLNQLSAWAGLTPAECVQYDTVLMPRLWVTLQPPPICATLYPTLGGGRLALADKGIGFYVFDTGGYDYDLLGHNANPQLYDGQNPTWQNTVAPVVTYDLSRIGFTPGAQLIFFGKWAASTFPPAYPQEFSVGSLSVDQPLFNNALDLRYGFIENVYNFYGVYVSASTIGNAQGPQSIIPHEAGLSLNEPTPTLEAVVRPFNKGLYDNIAASESAGADEVNNNPYGIYLRIPKSRALVVNELGYGRPGTSTWLRLGGIYNFTPKLSYKTGKKVNNNYDIYAGITYQLTNRGNPLHGLFMDVRADYAPEDRNLFARDVLVTFVDRGPFSERPLDQAAIGFEEFVFSPNLRNNLMAVDHTRLPSETQSYLASYAVFLLPGLFLTSTLNYETAPVAVFQNKPDVLILNEILTFAF